MSDHDPFLDAILAAPNDDAPRLIFADWLDEQSDAASALRAELIRVQCQRAATLPSALAQIELAAREEQLMRTPGMDWDGPVRGLLKQIKFRRGLIEQAECSAATFLQHGPALRAATPLRRLIIRDAWPRLKELLASPALAGLESLDLGGAVLHASELEALFDAPALHSLRELGLSCDAAVGEMSLEGLCGWDGLRSLRLTGLPFRGGLAKLGRAPWLSSLRELSLHLVDCEVGANDLAGLLTAPRLTDLRSIELNSPTLNLARHFDETWVARGMGHPYTDALAAAVQLDKLERLAFKRASVPPGGLRTLLDAPHIRRLRALHISHNGPWNSVRTEGAAELIGATEWTRLEELAFVRNGMQAGELRELTESRSLARLASLDLSRNLLGDAGARWLAASPFTRRLSQLDLSGNHIRPDGCLALADSAYVTQLRRLDLSDNPLGPTGAAALASSDGLRQLAVLRLEKTGLNKNAADALARSRALGGLMTLDVGANAALSPDHCAVLIDHYGPDVCVVPN